MLLATSSAKRLSMERLEVGSFFFLPLPFPFAAFFDFPPFFFLPPPLPPFFPFFPAAFALSTAIFRFSSSTRNASSTSNRIFSSMPGLRACFTSSGSCFCCTFQLSSRSCHTRQYCATPCCTGSTHHRGSAGFGGSSGGSSLPFFPPFLVDVPLAVLVGLAGLDSPRLPFFLAASSSSFAFWIASSSSCVSGGGGCKMRVEPPWSMAG
mmetsp:Transcript_43231/g.70156  ORF Transcript_43231/g.70156 Transcript_43231/m.70156 type:complete len:208 (+) Transcript_43231:1099-1722(+)